MCCSIIAMNSFIRFSSISALLVIILFINICYALYEDQVGLFDWRQQYIGKVKFAYFNQYSHSSRRALVGTESNVIAALNARTGSIIWRKVFENKHGNLDALLHHTSSLVSVSGYGKIIRSWEPNKGHLQWEVGKAEHSSLTGGKLAAGFPGWGSFLVSRKSDHVTTGVVSLYNNAVHMYTIKDGRENWTWRPSKDSKDSRSCLAVYGGLDEIFVVMQKNEIFMEITVLDTQTGHVNRNNVMPAPWLIDNSTSCTGVGNGFISCLNRQRSEVVIINMNTEDVTMTSTPFSKISASLESQKQVSISPLSQDNYYGSELIFKVQQHGNILAKINKENKVDFVHKFSSDCLLIASNVMSSVYLVSLELKDNGYETSVYELNAFKELESLKQAIPLEHKHGMPEYGSAYIFSKKDGELGYRLMVAFEDHALCLIQQSGTVLWEREEALAGIVSVEFIELPAATSASRLELLHEEFASVPNSGILSKFAKRVKIQLKQLELLMASLKKRKHYAFPDSASREQSSSLTRDQFGLHKIIVALTDSGKLFGLDTAKGKILWSRFLGDLSPFHVRGEEKMMLFVQRTTAHFPLPPQCVVVGRKKSGHGTLVYAFNPLTGDPADQNDPDGIIFPYDIMQVSLLPLTDERFCKAILLIDNQLKIHIFPETDESVSHLHERINSIYMHLVDQEKNTVKGYVLKDDQKPGGKEVATVEEAWSVKFPEDQQIQSIACKRIDEHVHSVGRVLGDRSVLYKYLNPNLIAFATVIPDASKPSTFIYVIDAVTGQIVHQSRHRSARGPVRMVLSENWLVYLIFNTKSRRTEISVVEMYEGFEEQNSTAFSSLESLDHPLVLSQGYLLPIINTGAMAVTNTERGITHKNLLLALNNGYIYSIPKNMLDPRRSFEQTAELAEEGLMPYIPELAVHPMTFINYNMTVEKIRGIHTSAAGLESTSLVLAFGLDLYYTRVTPSKLFDVLKEDFDYIFISGVLSALILGTIISSKLASFRKLSLSWL